MYDALGNVVGMAQGFPIPSNLGNGQTTLFNLQEKEKPNDRKPLNEIIMEGSFKRK